MEGERGQHAKPFATYEIRGGAARRLMINLIAGGRRRELEEGRAGQSKGKAGRAQLNSLVRKEGNVRESGGGKMAWEQSSLL